MTTSLKKHYFGVPNQRTARWPVYFFGSKGCRKSHFFVPYACMTVNRTFPAMLWIHQQWKQKLRIFKVVKPANHRLTDSQLRPFASHRIRNNLCPLVNKRWLSVHIRARVSVSTCVCGSVLWFPMPKLSVWGGAWRDVFIPGQPGWALRGGPL